MPRRNPETNVERVRFLMETGSPLIQAFVVTAIEKYAALCLEKGADHFNSDMLSGAAWIQCAEKAQDWADLNYSGIKPHPVKEL